MNSYSDFENIIFKFDGIIFGGYIRDLLINKYNSDCILSNDLDIYFKTYQIVLKFLCELKLYGDIGKIKTNSLNYVGMYRNLIVKEITFISNDMKFILDVVYPQLNTECLVEPPFNNLDFYANGFIKDINGIRFSNNTGTFIDDFHNKDKEIFINKIKNDMYNYKTELTLTNINKLNQSYMFSRIIKMLTKKNKWIIVNLPFKIINNTKKYKCSCCDYFSKNKIVKCDDLIYNYSCFIELLKFHVFRFDL